MCSRRYILSSVCCYYCKVYCKTNNNEIQGWIAEYVNELQTIEWHVIESIHVRNRWKWYHVENKILKECF